MWCGKSVSVIFPTYNEKESIRAAIEDFFSTGVVDEIVVVDNNAAPGTREEVAKTTARIVVERRQGYGAAIRRGLAEAKGDLLIVAEPDGTFVGRDVHKLLAYSDDFDIVYGTRTVNDFIWDGANMGLFLRWGNWAVAKLMAVLFNGPSLTDVGCTLRLLDRAAFERLQPLFTVDGSFFGPEMMLLSIHGRMDVVQVPINYLPRVGKSSVTGSFWKAFALGMRMIALILSHRLKRYVGWKPDDQPADIGNISAGVALVAQALLVASFVALAAAHLHDSFIIDEMDFPALGRAIAHTGAPFYYRGEELPRYAGIYHVPFYGYALGGWLKIFGDSVAAVRSFTLVCLLVAWALGLRILAQVCKALQIRFQAPGLFYSLVLLTSAYYIESSVLPDIDGTVLIVFYLGTITLLIDWMRLPTWKHAFWSGVMLGFCLLSKLTTTLGLFFLAPVAAWFGTRTGGAKRWAQALFILSSACVLFVVCWGALARGLSLDFWFPFRFSLQSASKGTAGSRLAAMLYNLRSNNREIAWLGYPLFAVLAIGLGRSVTLARQWRRGRGPVLVVAGGAMLVFAVYALIIGPVFWFTKYYVVALPLAAVTVALAMGVDGVLRLAREEVLGLSALFVLGFGWMAAFEKDLALFPFARTTLGMGHAGSPWIAAAIVALGIARLWSARREGRIGRLTVVLLPLLLLAIAQGIGEAWAQARADYSTRYYYGERGFERVVSILDSELRPGEPIFSAKDVGAATGHPFHEDAGYLYDPKALGEFLGAHGPRFVVTRKKFEFSMDFVPQARDVILRNGYHPWAEVDDFTIWRRDPQAVR